MQSYRQPCHSGDLCSRPLSQWYYGTTVADPCGAQNAIMVPYVSQRTLLSGGLGVVVFLFRLAAFLLPAASNRLQVVPGTTVPNS